MTRDSARRVEARIHEFELISTWLPSGAIASTVSYPVPDPGHTPHIRTVRSRDEDLLHDAGAVRLVVATAPQSA